MKRIFIEEEVHLRLLELMDGLRERTGSDVNYSDAIEYMLKRNRKHPALLVEACRPMPGADTAIEELMEERRKDSVDALF